MASFGSQIDFSKIIPEGANDDQVFLDMISAGQKIVQAVISQNASHHVRTGTMAKSVKISKSKYKPNSGSYIGFVGFSGKDKNGFLNAQKAVWLEYGTKNFSPSPVVRPAMKSAESAIASAMDNVWKSKIGGG